MSKTPRSDIHKWVKGNVPIVIAALLTCVVLGIASSLGHERVAGYPSITDLETEKISRWEWFFNLSPNEMGDTIAGLLGALTLIWIIASVFHQSKELADQREIMRMQKDEAELQRKATQEMAEALAAQTASLRYERILREQSEAKSELDELIVGISEILRETATPLVDVTLPDDKGDYNQVIRRMALFPPTEDKDSDEAIIRAAFRHSSTIGEEFEPYLSSYANSKIIVNFPEEGTILELIRKLSSTLQMRSRVSSAQQIRIERLCIEGLQNNLESLGVASKIIEATEDSQQ